jgi:hypothetical protein
MFVTVGGGNWRDGFEYAYTQPDPRGPRPHLAANSPPRLVGDVGVEGSAAPSPAIRIAGSLTCGPRTQPGLSPITTVGRIATVEEAQVAADEVWAAR